MDGMKEEEFIPEQIWKSFRRMFLLAYFVNNLFESLETKNKLISKEQKDFIIDGIRYMYRLFFYPKDICKADMTSEMNFMFHSLKDTFYKNLPEGSLEEYLTQYIPYLIQSNPAVNVGVAQLFEKKVFDETN